MSWVWLFSQNTNWLFTSRCQRNRLYSSSRAGL